MKMYFGSVKFFKHLIITIIVGFIITTALAVFFGIRLYVTSKGLDEDKNSLSNNSINIPENFSLDQFYLLLCAKGYTPEQILNFLAENERTSVNKFFENYDPDAVVLPDNTAADDPDAVDLDDIPSVTTVVDDVVDEHDTSLSYTKLYPDLYADAPTDFVAPEKVIYLTFDDGPSKNTLDILEILSRYKIKATFFMSAGGGEYEAEIMKKVADKGHTIGVHSISHKYTEVYDSVESWLEDFNNTYTSIYEATGVKPQLYRFPGGSINNYNRLIATQIIAEVTRRGFVYHDWNVSGEDATLNATWTSIYNNVLNGIESNSYNRAVILLHDSVDKYKTVTTLEDIIDALLDDGYSFAPLDNTVKPFTFSYDE